MAKAKSTWKRNKNKNLIFLCIEFNIFEGLLYIVREKLLFIINMWYVSYIWIDSTLLHSTSHVFPLNILFIRLRIKNFSFSPLFTLIRYPFCHIAEVLNAHANLHLQIQLKCKNSYYVIHRIHEFSMINLIIIIFQVFFFYSTKKYGFVTLNR